MADQENVVVIMKEKLISGTAAVLNVIYSVLKLLPVQKKITYISRQSNTLPVDFQLVMREMKRRHPDYCQVPLIRMIGKRDRRGRSVTASISFAKCITSPHLR